MSLVFSFSMINTFYNVCRRQAYHKYVVKDAVDTWTQRGGINRHKAVENHVRHCEPLPPDLQSLAGFLAKLRAPGRKVALELKLGLRADGTPTQFFANDVRWRMVPDILVYRENNDRAAAFDVKTGKPTQNFVQHALVAAGIFAHYPQINEVVARNIYSRTGAPGPEMRFERAAMPVVMEDIQARALELEHAFEDENCPPRQSPLCAYCGVKSCSFNNNPELRDDL
jgi:hypothetical protein